MKTITANFSKNSPATSGVYIKGAFEKEKSGKNELNNTAAEAKGLKEKAVVRHISEAPATNKFIAGNYKYTIAPGDNQKLNKQGILRVYNLKESIDIPVRRLLGNWKPSHVGVTLIVANGQWCTEDGSEHRIEKAEKGVLVALRLLLRFAMA